MVGSFGLLQRQAKFSGCLDEIRVAEVAADVALRGYFHHKIDEVPERVVHQGGAGGFSLRRLESVTQLHLQGHWHVVAN